MSVLPDVRSRLATTAFSIFFLCAMGNSQASKPKFEIFADDVTAISATLSNRPDGKPETQEFKIPKVIQKEVLDLLNGALPHRSQIDWKVLGELKLATDAGTVDVWLFSAGDKLVFKPKNGGSYETKSLKEFIRVIDKARSALAKENVEQDDAGKGKKTGSDQAVTEVRKLLEAGRLAATLPPGIVLRVSANLSTTRPSDPKERGEAEARGVDFEKSLKEMWEFTSNQVHRVVVRREDEQVEYERVESLPFDSKDLCKDLIDGKIFEIEAHEGEGESLLFAGTEFDLGGRSIEIIRNGKTVTHVSESCVFGGYAKSDALAFAALYESLATHARRLFKKPGGPSR